MKITRQKLRRLINNALLNEKNSNDVNKLFSGPTRVDSGPPKPDDKKDPFGGPTRVGDLKADPFVGGETIVDDKSKMVNLEQLNDYLDQMKATTQQFYRMNRSEIEKIAKKLKDVERVLMDFIDEMDQA